MNIATPNSSYLVSSVDMALTRVSWMRTVLLSLAMVSSVPAMAMDELAEDDLRGATGEGIAIVLSDFALKMGPTSFVELTGADEASGSELNYRRGDLRWYGISYTSAGNRTTGLTAGQAWSGPCSNGILNMGCPLGGTIANLAPHDNPLLLRAYDYTGRVLDSTGSAQSRSVFEVLFPSQHERYRFAFWGEMNVGTNSTVGTGNTSGSTIGLGGDKLQVQNIWSNISQGGSVFRLFQTSETDVNSRTLGIQFINHFEADIRMSAAQRMGSPDTLGQTPEFDDNEGLYIGNYRVHMATGQLFYQALVLDDVAVGNGNFQISVTQLPATPAIYNEFYGRTITTDPTGGYDRTKIDLTNTNYHKTHGYVRMGDWAPTHKAQTSAALPYTPAAYGATDATITSMPSEVAYAVNTSCMPDRSTCSKNTPYSTSDGVFFVAAPGESFTVFRVSPNYMSDPGTSTNSSTNIDADLNANNILNNTPVAGDFSGRATDSLTRINLGDVNIQGMTMHSLSLKTLGAN